MLPSSTPRAGRVGPPATSGWRRWGTDRAGVRRSRSDAPLRGHPGPSAARRREIRKAPSRCWCRRWTSLPTWGGSPSAGSSGAACRVGERVALLPLGAPGSVEDDDEAVEGRVMRLYEFAGLQRLELDQAVAGDIVALAGVDGVEIGTTLTDPEVGSDSRGIAVEEPTLSVDFLVNNSPFSGRAGKVRHQPATPGASLPGAGAEPGAAGGGDGFPRHVHGVRAGRASPDHPHGDHAPGGVRVPGVPTPGDPEGGPGGWHGWSRTRRWSSRFRRAWWGW